MRLFRPFGLVAKQNQHRFFVRTLSSSGDGKDVAAEPLENEEPQDQLQWEDEKDEMRSKLEGEESLGRSKQEKLFFFFSFFF
jgi:hypothetical protein